MGQKLTRYATTEKAITLADSPYTATPNYNCIKVNTAGGNVRVNLPTVDYPIDVIKTSSDSYIVTVWVGGVQKATVAGELSKITIENAEVTKDEPWYPYDAIVGIAGVSGDGGEILAKNKYGKVISNGRGVAGVNDKSVLQYGISAASGGRFKAFGNFVFGVGNQLSIPTETYLDFHGSSINISALSASFALRLNTPSNNILIDGLDLIDDGHAYGINRVEGAENFHIMNSRITDVKSTAIGGGTTGCVTLSHCTVSSAYNTSYLVDAPEAHIDDLYVPGTYADGAVTCKENSYVINSKFVDCSQYAIRSNRSNNIRIANNTIKWTVTPSAGLNPVCGILLFAQADGAINLRNVVDGNRIIVPTGVDIWVGLYIHSYTHGEHNNKYHAVTNNSIYGPIRGINQGYDAYGYVLSGNTISDCIEHGIYMESSYCRIHHNNIINCPVGYADFGNIGDEGNNQVESNFFDGCAVPVSTMADIPTWFHKNIGYPTDASGSSTGTGSEQTIAHGLAVIPVGCKAWITYLVGTRYVTEMIPFDATNVYPTVATGTAYNWRIE